MTDSTNIGRLFGLDEIAKKARQAGCNQSVFWRRVVAPQLKSLSQYDRDLMHARAYDVSHDIIPIQTIDSQYFPAFLKKADRSAIPWNALQREYGVDRRYVATAFLYALERYGAKPYTLSPFVRNSATARKRAADGVLNSTILKSTFVSAAAAEHLGVISVDNTTPKLTKWNMMRTACIVVGRMDKAYIASLIATGRFNETLGLFAPEIILARAEAVGKRVAREFKQRAQKYPANESWAAWRLNEKWDRQRKATKIAEELLRAIQATASVSPLMLLANILRTHTTTVTRRPSVAATLLYAHKHLHTLASTTYPELRPILDIIDEHANAYALHHIPHTKPEAKATILWITDPATRAGNTPPLLVSTNLPTHV